MADLPKNSFLLADVISEPSMTKKEHSHLEESPKGHTLKSPSPYIASFERKGLIRKNFPNFYKIGFTSQAFVDVKIGDGKKEPEIKKSLHEIPGVIKIYTIFGDIDLRCKVVGIDLHSVEKVAMEIRNIEGVYSSTTNIILDDTNRELMLKNWGELVKKNGKHIEDFVKKDENNDDAYVDEDED